MHAHQPDGEDDDHYFNSNDWCTTCCTICLNGFIFPKGMIILTVMLLLTANDGRIEAVLNRNVCPGCSSHILHPLCHRKWSSFTTPCGWSVMPSRSKQLLLCRFGAWLICQASTVQDRFWVGNRTFQDKAMVDNKNNSGQGPC